MSERVRAISTLTPVIKPQVKKWHTVLDTTQSAVLLLL